MQQRRRIAFDLAKPHGQSAGSTITSSRSATADAGRGVVAISVAAGCPGWRCPSGGLSARSLPSG